MTTLKLYAIQAGTHNLFKIGHTKQEIQNRINGLQTGCPYPLQPFRVVDHLYAKEIEKAIHRSLKEKLVYKEWFNVSPELVTSIFDFVKTWQNWEPPKGLWPRTWIQAVVTSHVLDTEYGGVSVEDIQQVLNVNRHIANRCLRALSTMDGFASYSAKPSSRLRAGLVICIDDSMWH